MPFAMYPSITHLDHIARNGSIRFDRPVPIQRGASSVDSAPVPRPAEAEFLLVAGLHSDFASRSARPRFGRPFGRGPEQPGPQMGEHDELLKHADAQSSVQ